MSNEQAKPTSIGTMTVNLETVVDNSALVATLALLEKITAAANEATSALAAIGAAPAESPATRAGYWQLFVGSSQPVWIELQPQTRTPPLEAQAVAGSHSQAEH